MSATTHSVTGASPLFTQLVGSYSMPGWLTNHHRVTTPTGTFWRPESEVLGEAQDDATRLAIFDQERAGLDIVTDGEQRRERFDTYFFGLDGIDTERLSRWSMAGRDLSFLDLDPTVAERLRNARTPRVVGPVKWRAPIALADLRFLKRHASRPVKTTVIGPLTMAARLADEYYGDERALGLACAAAINRELRTLDQEGAAILQLDEPDFHFRHDLARAWGTDVLDIALAGIRATTAVHVCYGYATLGGKRADTRYGEVIEAIAASGAQWISIEYEQPGHGPELLAHARGKSVILGLLDCGAEITEDPPHLSRRIREAMEMIPAHRLHLAPDCGMWFLPRAAAFAKLRALTRAARSVRKTLGLD